MSRGRGYLVLEDGTTFRGRSVGAEGVAFGEAVFTTAMTGYQETVTDPSYAEQLVSEDGFRSLSANSWLLGETLRGKVVRTVADGRVVFALEGAAAR